MWDLDVNMTFLTISLLLFGELTSHPNAELRRHNVLPDPVGAYINACFFSSKVYNTYFMYFN